MKEKKKTEAVMNVVQSFTAKIIYQLHHMTCITSKIYFQDINMTPNFLQTIFVESNLLQSEFIHCYIIFLIWLFMMS